MQQLSLVTSDAPTVQDACHLATQLRFEDDVRIAVGMNAGRMVVQFTRGQAVTNLPLEGKGQPLDPEAARLFAEHLKDYALDVIEVLSDDERFHNVGSHLLMVMYHYNRDEIVSDVRAELREELARQGYAVPPLPEDDRARPTAAVC